MATLAARQRPDLRLGALRASHKMRDQAEDPPAADLADNDQVEQPVIRFRIRCHLESGSHPFPIHGQQHQGGSGEGRSS